MANDSLQVVQTNVAIFPDGPVKKTDKLNEPTLLDFVIYPVTGYTKPTRGNYIAVTTNKYGVWFTGFITNDPELEYLGVLQKQPKWGYHFHATSDEYLLNLKPIGIVPPFINTTQGAILKYLVNQLTPAGWTFDTTNIMDGQQIPRYVVDPTKHFSDIVKEFADNSHFRFYTRGLNVSGNTWKTMVYFQPMDFTPATIAVDGSDKHFTPIALSVKQVSDQVINDAIVAGDVEPQAFMHEYFIGDGSTGSFPLVESAYGSDSAILLDDDFSSGGQSSFDNSKWTVFNDANGSLRPYNGFLNCLGGSQNFSYDVYLQSANLIPLEGNLRITHGEFDFVNSGLLNSIVGVIGGLWTGAPDSSFSNLAYGLVVARGTDGTMFINPAVLGARTANQIIINYNHRYIFRTVVSTQRTHRYFNQYSYLSQAGTVSSVSAPSVLDQVTYTTVIAELDPLTGAVINTTTWTDSSYLQQTWHYAYYCPIVSNDLHCTMTGVTVSVPLQASLEIRKKGNTAFTGQMIGPNELDSYDGLAPVATIMDSNNGVSTKNSLLGSVDYNPGQAQLQFFKDTVRQISTVPQAGDLVHLAYRVPGASIARVQNKSSVATESAAWGDDGIRSVTRRDLTPLPRNSFECEMAAAALIKDQGYTHYTGMYTMPSGAWFSGEPVSGTVLKFKNMPTDFPAALQAEAITQVVTTFDHSQNGNNEQFTHQISFGLSGDAIAQVLARLQNTNDVFTPHPTVEMPYYIDVNSVGTSFAADVPKVTLDTSVNTYGVDNNYFYINTNQIPEGQSGFELRYSDDSWGADAGKNLITRNLNMVTLKNFDSGTGFWDVSSGQSTRGVTGMPFKTAYKTCYRDNIENYLLPVTINQTLYVACWVNTLNLAGHPNDGGSWTVRFGIQGLKSTGAYYWVGVGGIQPGNGWTYISGTVQTPDGSQSPTGVEPWFQIDNNFNTNQTYYALFAQPYIGFAPPSSFQVPRTYKGKTFFVRSYDTRNRVRYSEDLTQWSTGGVSQPTVTTVVAKNADNDFVPVSRVAFPAWNGSGIPPEVYQLLANSSNGLVQGSIAAGKTATFTCDLLGTAGQQVVIIISAQAGSFPAANKVVTLTGHWQRVSVTATFASNQPGWLCPVIQSQTASPVTVQITRASVELASAETVYCKSMATEYGVTSRFSTGMKVALPSIPPSPSGVLSAGADAVYPTLDYTLPSNLADVWGIEIRKSDNTTKLVSADLSNTGYLLNGISLGQNTSRSPVYYLYTYNILGEYSAPATVSGTFSPTTITSASVSDTTAILSISFTLGTAALQSINVIAWTNSSRTQQLWTNSAQIMTVASAAMQLDPVDFYNSRYYEIYARDELGNGTSYFISHTYNPPAPIEFNQNEVFVVAPLATPTSTPSNPSGYPASNSNDYAYQSYLNYIRNRLLG